MKALRETLGWRGGMAPQSNSIEPLENRGYVLYPISPLHGVGVPQSWNMEVASKDTGSPKEIGWKKCPGGDHSHLGRVAWRLITE